MCFANPKTHPPLRGIIGPTHRVAYQEGPLSDVILLLCETEYRCFWRRGKEDANLWDQYNTEESTLTLWDYHRFFLESFSLHETLKTLSLDPNPQHETIRILSTNHSHNMRLQDPPSPISPHTMRPPESISLIYLTAWDGTDYFYRPSLTSWDSRTFISGFISQHEIQRNFLDQKLSPYGKLNVFFDIKFIQH